MSRIFEALQQSAFEREPSDSSDPTSATKLPELIVRIGEDSTSLSGVPKFSLKGTPEKRLVALTDNVSLGAEKFRILSARLKQVQQLRSVKKLLITSTIRAEGKTLVAANLGITLAQQRRKVLLIDGDLHQPSLGQLLAGTARPGLSDWWKQQREITDFLCRAEGLPLWLLPAGTQPDQPLTMLQSSEVGQLIANISGWFDWVIIDSPPLAPLADAGVWGTLADSILLVTRQGITPKKVFEESIASLDRSKILGVVLNDADSTEHRYYSGYYKLYGEQTAKNGSGRGQVQAPGTFGKNGDISPEL